MFEQLRERAARLCQARAVRRRELLAARLEEIAPAGVEVAQEERAVVLQGRLPDVMELRWLVAEAKDDR